jgi:hypothetical protein
MLYSASGYERTAEECVRLARQTRDRTLMRGLLQLRLVCLGTAKRLRAEASHNEATRLPQQPNALAKRILKLRWIGMDEDAYRLQLAVRSLPPEQRGTVSAGPFSTD